MISIYNIKGLNSLYGDEIEKRYLQEESLAVLAKDYLESEKRYGIIKKILKYRNISIRTRSQVKQISDKTNLNPYLNGKHYFVNEDYFKTWSHKMAYILGYIATDGNINSDRVLKFGLKSDDVDLLEKIKEELEFTGNIYDKEIHSKQAGKTYYAKVMNIYSKKLVQDLKGLGIIENKSLILSSFNIPEEYEMDFICGVFDGDGSVGKSGGKQVKNNSQIRLRFFSASYEFIKYLHDIMVKHGFKDVNINEIKRKNPFYEILYSTKDSIRFYNEFYKDMPIFIDRKHNKFSELIQQRINYENSKQSKKYFKS